jgi:hypothetical protein
MTYATSTPGAGIENRERTNRRDTKLSPILREIKYKTHFDVDFIQRRKSNPWHVQLFFEVKDQYDGEWRPAAKRGEWCLTRQLAWSWSKAHPEYDPAIAILVYVRAAPDPRMKVYFYEPDATVSEKDDVMHGKINGPIEMTPDQFIEWCQEL